MKKFPVLFFALFQIGFLAAQNNIPSHWVENITHPVIDFGPWVGVFTIEPQALKYDPNLDYKVALDIYDSFKDSTKVNGALREVARTYNLLVANGAPREKMKITAVIHAGSVYSILSEEEYMTRYGISNPNLPLIEKLKEAGVELYVCGQNLGMYQLNTSQITPEVKVALSAKTALITLDQMGYSFLNVSGK
jgi:intracellular sulfur oxidation DsrE/DsrF family protein